MPLVSNVKVCFRPLLRFFFQALFWLRPARHRAFVPTLPSRSNSNFFPFFNPKILKLSDIFHPADQHSLPPISARCSDAERHAWPFRDGPPPGGACRCGLTSMASVLDWGFASGGSPRRRPWLPRLAGFAQGIPRLRGGRLNRTAETTGSVRAFARVEPGQTAESSGRARPLTSLMITSSWPCSSCAIPTAASGQLPVRPRALPLHLWPVARW